MNCVNHAETANAAFCIRCGHALCSECIRTVRGSVYCEECLAGLVENKATPPGSTGAARQETLAGTNPGAAFALGLIPGVGAIYNGEYFKAAVHIIAFALLVEMASMPFIVGDALFGFLAFGFYVYMPFEAYYTAKKRKLHQEGIELETPFDRFNQQLAGIKNRDLWSGGTLIVLGVLFLLENLDVLQMERVLRLWPIILIIVGVWLLNRYMERAA
jgi:hypothetical protein